MSQRHLWWMFYFGLSACHPVYAADDFSRTQTSCEVEFQGQESNPTIAAEDSDPSFEGDIVVVDTNVFILNPTAWYDFPGARIVVPFKVLQEIDRFKHEGEGRGLSARQFSRSVEKFRARGNLLKGVKLENGSIVQFLAPSNNSNLPKGFDPRLADDQILAAAFELKAKYKNTRVVMVSEDVNVRIKADIHGLEAVQYRPLAKKDETSSLKLFSGVTDIESTQEQLSYLRDKGALPLSALGEAYSHLAANEFVIFNLKDSSGQIIDSLATRYDANQKLLITVQSLADFNLPIEARNREQELALNLLLDDRIKLVTMVGKAGTGKTLLAMAAGMLKSLWIREPVYDEVMLARPMVTMGKDPGALPGDIRQKMDPFLQPYYDNLDILVNMMNQSGWRPEKPAKNSSAGEGPMRLTNKQYKHWRHKARERSLPDRGPEFELWAKAQIARQNAMESQTQPVASQSQLMTAPKSGKEILNSNKVKIEPLNFIRGRSLPRRFMIIDEAQNLSVHEIKTIITRAGEGTKIVFVGDIGQIDAPYLHAYNNGLSFLVEHFKDRSIAGHVTLLQGERSELADVATEVFERFGSR